MFVLASKIEIGDFVFTDIHNVEITKSVDLIEDTAVIKLPTSFRVKQNNELKYTEDVIKSGDKVIITLSYLNVFENVEFTGFVNKINPKYPLEIYCEDALWLLKRINVNKIWNTSVTLKTVLEHIVKDTGISLATNNININFDKYGFKNVNGAQALQQLKKEVPGMVVFLNDNGELYFGLEQGTNVFENVVYDLNYNIVENNLEFKTKEDKKLKIRYTYIAPNNKRTVIEVGDTDGALKSYQTSVISSPEKLKELANEELNKLKYDGFSGTIKSFLVPYATRGMKAILADEEYKNREGDYFIKKVVIDFGLNGARRTVTIGTKL